MSDCVVDQGLHVSSFWLCHILLCKRARQVELSDKGHMRDLLSQDTGYSISYIITVKITYIEQVNYCSNNNNIITKKKMKNLKGPRCCGSSSLDRLSGFLVPLPQMCQNDTLGAFTIV